MAAPAPLPVLQYFGQPIFWAHTTLNQGAQHGRQSRAGFLAPTAPTAGSPSRDNPRPCLMALPASHCTSGLALTSWAMLRGDENEMRVCSGWVHLCWRKNGSGALAQSLQITKGLFWGPGTRFVVGGLEARTRQANFNSTQVRL